ncbi:MAG: N-6 DNA methylase, partial [Candidatus Sabulitectum sp.]|nr:N-6 DNA methylase [Candidatus Sabulitectum sp.]
RTKPQDYNHSGQKLNEVISRAWNTLQVQWEHFSKTEDPTTAQTRERWLIPLFRELDYGNLKRSEKHHIDGKDYPISHTRDNVPIHLLGTQTSLDHRTQKITRQIPHSMFQEYLNKSETPTWGILSNGNKLRVLRENVSMTRQAYIEFDLQKMMEGKTYSDFVLLYLICHESRFTTEEAKIEETETGIKETRKEEEKKEKTKKKQTQIIEAWSQTAKKDGIRALDSLRTGVKQAIEALGKGFLNNQAIRNKLREDEAFKQDYYRQLLRAVYRMIFMLTAESRNLLLNPEATQEAIDRYNNYYSITRIRNLAEKRRGTRHKDLWHALNITISKLCSTESTEALGITPLGSFLWSPQATEDLNEATLENLYLLQAIRAITQTTKENITTRVDYRNLGSEELGSIYESLLEMKPRINADARQFNLNITAGNERKTTGSYYTPTELINELLNSALDPVIKTKKTEEEILDTKICDPACGSGHFLI